MRYLKDGDRVYSTGCFLIYDQKINTFRFDELDDDTYFDSKFINFDENSKPFIEEGE